ncbi:MAG: HD domain-containing protein [Ktedonobacterales bacterium]
MSQTVSGLSGPVSPASNTSNTSDTADTSNTTTDTTTSADDALLDEGRFLRTIADYLRPDDVHNIEVTLAYVRELEDDALSQPAAQSSSLATHVAAPRALRYVLSVAQTLAEGLHIDAVTLAAVLLAPAVERGASAMDAMEQRLGAVFGEQVAQTIRSIEQFDVLQRPGARLRRNALVADTESDTQLDRERRRSRERRRQQDADTLRKMFLTMAENPRVVVIKIADQLRLMRGVREAADSWRLRAQQNHTPEAWDTTTDTAQDAAPLWTLEECRLLAEETRTLYAPLAGRLGMGKVEGELEDLAFAILQPDEYRWLSEAVAVEANERRAYVERVCALLREEMRTIGIQAEVSGRVKHLYSIYRKVMRSGSRDLAQLYDILAFRILVGQVEECYQALGHVHELWRPIDGRFKDFIASPKPNGYQSLHTTVFCLDDQLAEIQIRTRAMHQVAEYGVAMHWYYKDVGDSATARAKPLQAWVQQVVEWQQELQETGTGQSGAGHVRDALPTDPLQEQIFVLTPAGDAKELPAGSTPLDFAYRVHTDLGNHVAGVRITSEDSTGRTVRKMAPLDYELKSGDVVELIKRNDAHPTRDWLRVVKTKLARNRILHYLKTHERAIDIQVGRERLDRELRGIGIRRGYDELSDDDLTWLSREMKQSDDQSLLAAIGSDRVRMGTVLAKLRERLQPPAPPAAGDEALVTALASAPSREPQTSVSVEGMAGLLTQIASCCNPLPGDPLRGFITKGRGVVIHRTDCPNLRHLLERHPERGIEVAWPTLDGKQTFRAPVYVEGTDRTGFLRDVTAVISGHKINMLKVDTVTRPRAHQAVVNAILEIHRPEELDAVLAELRSVAGVLSAERKEPTIPPAAGARGARPPTPAKSEKNAKADPKRVRRA